MHTQDHYAGGGKARRTSRWIAAWAVAAMAIVALGSAARGDPLWWTQIGYTQLKAELGSGTPTGTGVKAAQVEALDGGNYAPSLTDTQFMEKTITLKSGASGVSGHATTVGQYLYGTSSSTSPEITQIDSWRADDWIAAGFLKTATTAEPGVQDAKVQTDSWIGLFGTTAEDVDALRRLDYTINRDNYVCIASLKNGVGTLPPLLCQNYNGISVGRSDGQHSYGVTTVDGTGRTKPDIVAPASATSWAGPMVASSAAVLWEAGSGNAHAQQSVTVKAMLMAGATKSEFPSWDRTQARPLDEVYGAGELNIYNSYHIFAAGEQEASTSADVQRTGWDFDTVSSASRQYFFDVPVGYTLDDMSILLTWNRLVEDGRAGPEWGDPTSFLANLSLELWTADGYSLLTELDCSDSAADNVELIYASSLSSGRYAFSISNASGTS